MDKTNLLTDWLRPYWFQPNTLQSFDYENPLFLWLIPCILLLWLLRWLFHFKFRKSIEVAFFERHAHASASAWLRFVPPVFFSLFLALLLLALARPQKVNEKVEQYTEGIDIVLVLDISESMKIEDFKPNRLEAAKRVGQSFVEGRNNDRIGLVIFSGEAYSLSPLTTDYELLNEYLSTIDFGMVEEPGTAIGSALATAVNRMLESEATSRVVILLSDGDNTAGNIDPKTAAELAAAYDIKLYTIGVGKNGRVPFGRDAFGNTQYVENTLDETSLREIADIGSGSFFRATNNEALQQIFDNIDQLERSEIIETRFKETKDFYRIYLTWAIVLFLFWLATKSTFINNVLED